MDVCELVTSLFRESVGGGERGLLAVLTSSLYKTHFLRTQVTEKALHIAVSKEWNESFRLIERYMYPRKTVKRENVKHLR